MNDGYIRLFRKFVEWEWYSNVNDRLVFIHCLLSANWKDGYFEGEKIPRGSFVTSYQKLAKEIGISVQNVRTSINHLKSTSNLTSKKTNKYSIITINNYEKYQETNKQINNQLTSNQQATNNNRRNNNKGRIKESISKDIPKKVFTKPSLEQIQEYCKERCNNVDFERFYDFYESKGWMVGSNKMKDWKACVRTWEKKSDRGGEKLPDWFNNEPKERERTEDEERELQELIRGY